MMDCEVLSEEEYFGEFYMETFSDCPSDIYIYIYIYIYVYTSVPEDDNSSEYSSY